MAQYDLNQRLDIVHKNNLEDLLFKVNKKCQESGMTDTLLLEVDLSQEGRLQHPLQSTYLSSRAGQLNNLQPGLFVVRRHLKGLLLAFYLWSLNLFPPGHLPSRRLVHRGLPTQNILLSSIWSLPSQWLVDLVLAETS